MAPIMEAGARGEIKPSKIIKIGNTDIYIGYSFLGIIKFIKNQNTENVPISVWTNQEERELRFTLPFDFSSKLPNLKESESWAFYVGKLKEQEFNLPNENKTRMEINPLDFYLVLATKRSEYGTSITGISISTRQSTEEVKKIIKTEINEEKLKNWHFNKPI
jgi:hypothetical protein